MLQQMRKLPKWVAFIVFLPLVVSFGVWGIADIFRGSTDTSIASVGSVKIDSQIFARDFNNLRRNAAARNGGQLSPAQAQALGQSSLQHEISNTALDNVAQSLGLTTTDGAISSAIRAIPAFRGPLGAFDQATFQQALDRISFTQAAFVTEMRRELTREQLVRAGSNGLVLPPGYVHAFFSYLNEHRAVQYVVLPADAAGPIAPPSDAVLAAFTKSHPDRFSTPEYRTLTYATIGLDDAAKQVSVSDAQIHQTYDLRKDVYIVPEKRGIQRINFPDEASAKAARAKIDAGAKFEEIATLNHTAPSDLDLGTLTQADLGPLQGPAAFALPVGGITQPVKFTFGWSLLRVTAITQGSTKTFDDMKADIEAELVKQLAASRIEDVLNAFDDARNAGADLAEAAKKVGMKVVHVAATDIHGLAPDGSKANVPASPDFLAQVFKSDVGNEGDPFALPDGNRYVLKIEGVVPQKLKSLDSVRVEATADWIAGQRAVKLAAKAAALARQIDVSGDIGAVAAELHVPLQSSPALERGTPAPDIAADLNAKIFGAPPGTAVFAPSASGDGFVVARITGVIHPPLPLGDPRLQQFVRLLGNQASTDLEEGMGTAARDKQGVTINQQQVERVLGGEGS